MSEVANTVVETTLHPLTEEMPPQLISVDVLLEKYAKEGEKTIGDVRRRVATAVAQCEDDSIKGKIIEEFLWAMDNGFIPAGRINSAAGSKLKATMINCFTQYIADSITDEIDGKPGIYQALSHAAETMRKGGGVGYNFSHIRPNGAYVKGTDSFASGPLSYMKIFNVSCETVESAGCFAPDVRIHTTDGLIKVKDIVESDKDYYAVTHLGPKKITAKFRNGVKPIYEVITHDGHSVRVTRDHKFAMFEDGKITTKPIKEIMAGNNYEVIISLPKEDPIKPKWDREELNAYFVGAFLGKSELYGDGTGYISVVHLDMEDVPNLSIEDIKEFAASYGFAVTCGQVKEKWELTFKELADVNPGRPNIDPRDTLLEILEAPRNLQAALLAGYALQSKIGSILDSNFNDLGERTITWNEQILKVAKVIQMLLGSFGVYSKITPFKLLSEITIPSQAWISELKDSLGDFLKINLDLGEKKFTCSNLICTNIVSYNLIGMDETYDLEVEDVHLLSGDGIYTSNSRRGAQMGMLNVNHPDILPFIRAKDNGDFKNFNLSVAVTDEFMNAVVNDSDFNLIHTVPKHKNEDGPFELKDGVKWYIYETIKARDLWETIMKSTYDHAEPGIIFIDRVNNQNNLQYCETIEATNPCAEQPLPPYGCCCLGSINLTKFIKKPFERLDCLNDNFDYEMFNKVVGIATRFLDNVLNTTEWPLEQQRQEAMNKRRVGLGYTGLGDALIMLGVKYNSSEAHLFVEDVTKAMRDQAYYTSTQLATEKGAFPFLDRNKYLASPFVKRLPSWIQKAIKDVGIRNSHLISIAPTGTISLAFADNASNGIEPPFSWVYNRNKRNSDGSSTKYEVADHAWRLYREMGGDVNNLPDYFMSALTISATDHAAMLRVVQPYVDSSISKCVVEGTPIITNKGILPIEELGEANTVEGFAKPLDDLKVLCPDGEWREVTQHYYGGERPTIKVRLNNGREIEGSHVHKLMTTNGWVQMSDLKIGSYVKVRKSITLNYPGGAELDDLIRHNNSKECFVPKTMSPDLALFLGMMCSDGHLQETAGLVSVTKNDPVVGEAFIRLSRQLFGLEAKHHIDPRNDVNSWYFNSRSICRWLRNLIGYRAGDKFVPSEIMSGSSDEMKSFLAGLSLDGYVVRNDHNTTTCLYCGKSKKLADGAFSLLKALGFNPRLRTKVVIGYGYRVYGVEAAGIDFCMQDFKNSKGSTLTEYVKIPEYVYDLKLSSTAVPYYARRNWIGQELSVCKENIFINNFGNDYEKDYIYYEVTSITHGSGNIYDIEVKDSHDYLIDGIVSHNTCNIPVDYPYEDFKDIYMKAWEWHLKGISTYRPNQVMGSVLEVKKEEPVDKPQELEVFSSELCETIQDIDPLKVTIDSRPEGVLESISDKGYYYTQEGKFTYRLTIGFMKVEGTINGMPVEVKRPIEFFLSTDGSDSQQWINCQMRTLSLVARSGDFLNKAIKNMIAVSWENGPVRLGYRIKDGNTVPVNHISLVSALGWKIQQLLIERGFFDKYGNARDYTEISSFVNYEDQLVTELAQRVSESIKKEVVSENTIQAGKKCPECGEHAYIKVDGCTRCTACGYIGTCG